MNRARRAGWLAWLLACGVACGDDAAPAADAGRPVAPRRDAGPPDESLKEPGTPGALRDAYRVSVQANELSLASATCPADDAADLACFTATVPVSWQQPILGLIGLFARKLPASGDPVRQLWLLGDGPGVASGALRTRARALAAAWPGTEVWWLDYRGAGRSDRLACPGEEDAAGHLPGLEPVGDAGAARVERCFRESRVRWANDIFLFSLTETAADLAGLVEAVRSPELPVFFYGLGWGSRVAHEYLKLFPDGVDGVVLDSFAVPASLGDPDAAADAALRGLLRACAEDAACVARLGPDPAAFARGVLQGMTAGACPALADRGLDASGFRRLLGQLMADPPSWPLVPVALYRAERCAAADVGALAMLSDSLRPTGVPEAGSEPSDALRLLQLAALQAPEPAGAVLAREATLLAVDGVPLLLASYADSIPTRAPNALHAEWADSSVPVLVLQGGLDAHAPPDHGLQASMHFAGPSRHLVQAPVHGPGLGLDDACGRALVGRFVQDPTGTPDASCLEGLVVDFAIDPVDASARLGDPDGWGG